MNKTKKPTLAQLAARMTPYTFEAINNMYAMGDGDGIPTILASHEALRNQRDKAEHEADLLLAKIEEALTEGESVTVTKNGLVEKLRAILEGKA